MRFFLSGLIAGVIILNSCATQKHQSKPSATVSSEAQKRALNYAVEEKLAPIYKDSLK